MPSSPSTTSPDHIVTWIIEDNAAYRSNMAEMLDETDNISCEHDFSSCEEALECLQETSAKPQVILVDLSLPGLGGIEGIQQICALYPDIKCIVLTGSDRHHDVFESISAGAAGYLLKNIDIDHVIQSIEDVMNGGASLDPHVTSLVLNAFPKASEPPQEHDLTDRETEVLRYLADGMIIKQISDHMHISAHTVKYHVANTYKKLNVQSQAGAVAKGIRKGII